MKYLVIVILAAAMALPSCGPRRVVRPQATLSAPEGAGAWLFYLAVEQGVEVPVIGEELLSATEVPLPKDDDGATVLTLTEKGLFLRGEGIAPVQSINEVLHLIVESGKKTPEGEIPETIQKAMAAANPVFNTLKSETHRGNRKVYLVADHRTSAASLAAIGIAGLFSGYAPPVVVGISPDGTPRGMRLTGAKPCPGVAAPKTPPRKRVLGMDGEPSSFTASGVTQIGDCKGLERPDWFNRRLESIGHCFMEEVDRNNRDGGDGGTLTLVVDAAGNLQSTSLRSPWAGGSPALQQCVHQNITAMRAPIAKGACILARSFRFEAGSMESIRVHAPKAVPPHYGRTVKWAFAAVNPDTIFMDVHHEGDGKTCPRTTTGALGWNVRGAEVDKSRMDAVLSGIEFDLDFLGIRVLGSMPLSDLINTATMWARKGTRVGITVRRF